MQVLGFPILKFYGLMDKYALIQNWYEQYSAWAVALAGLTPIPYKLCTLTAGAFKISWPIFVLASTLSRGLRFYAIAGLIYWQGERARYFLEKRFDLILCLTIFLVILGFFLLKFI
jgi:membrane protein YqaA with SNARE-associated domain